MSLRRSRRRRRSRCLPHKRNVPIALKWFWRKRISVVSAATSLVLRFPWHPCRNGRKGVNNEEEQLYATRHSNVFSSFGVETALPLPLSFRIHPAHSVCTRPTKGF